MIRFFRRIALAVLIALFLAPAALAQGNQGEQPPPPPAPDVEVSDAELETVAGVLLEIQALQVKYRPKMDQAENQEEAQQVQMEFRQEMTEKLEAEEDITPQRFGTIMRAAQADKELQDRITSAMATARGEDENDN